MLGKKLSSLSFKKTFERPLRGEMAE